MSTTIWLLHAARDRQVIEVVQGFLHDEGLKCTHPLPPNGEAVSAPIRAVLLLSRHVFSDTQVEQQAQWAVEQGIPVVVLRLQRGLELPVSLLRVLGDVWIVDAYGIPQREHLRCLAAWLQNSEWLKPTPFVPSESLSSMAHLPASQSLGVVGKFDANSPDPVPRGLGKDIERRDAVSALKLQLERHSNELRQQMEKYEQQGKYALARRTARLLLRLHPMDRDADSMVLYCNEILAKTDRRRELQTLGLWPWCKALLWMCAAVLTRNSFVDYRGGTQFFINLGMGLVAGFAAFCLYVRFTPRAGEEEAANDNLQLKFLGLIGALAITSKILEESDVPSGPANGWGLLVGMALLLVPKIMRLFRSWVEENAFMISIVILMGAYFAVVIFVLRLDENWIRTFWGFMIFLALIVCLSLFWTPFMETVRAYLHSRIFYNRRLPTQQLPVQVRQELEQLQSLYDEFEFDAFISYKHDDQIIARALHTRLETYRTPRELAALGLPTRLRRVFLDNDEFAGASELSTAIERALRRSRFLIVICSQRTPKSAWVAKEIKLFRSLGGGEQILPVLLEGEPATAFPEALLQSEEEVHLPDGTRKFVMRLHEPLAVDIRARDRKSPLRLLSEAVPRLVAPILGCGFSDLKQRELQRFRTWWYVIGGVVFLGLGILISLFHLLS